MSASLCRPQCVKPCHDETHRLTVSIYQSKSTPIWASICTDLAPHLNWFRLTYVLIFIGIWVDLWWQLCLSCQQLFCRVVDPINISVSCQYLTHWGRVMHICIGKLTIIDSDNGLSPVRRQTIIWTNDGMLLIWPLGTNFSKKITRNSYIFIQINAFESVLSEMLVILSWPQCNDDTHHLTL